MLSEEMGKRESREFFTPSTLTGGGPARTIAGNVPVIP
jgi:hypothetical protein